MLLSIHMWFLLKGTRIIPANSSGMLHVCTGWRPSQFTVVLSSESQVIQSRQGRLERPVLWFVNICLGLKLLWRPTKNIWACSVYISRIMRKPTGDLLVAPGFKLSLKIYPCPTWPDFIAKSLNPRVMITIIPRPMRPGTRMSSLTRWGTSLSLTDGAWRPSQLCDRRGRKYPV
jgi:hypothetical protein